MEICAMCGRAAECTHHLIFGTSRRKLADADKLTIKCCNECHNLAIKPIDRIHGNPKAEMLSKMLGQALFERDYIEKNAGTKEKARDAFRQRYGGSYL